MLLFWTSIYLNVEKMSCWTVRLYLSKLGIHQAFRVSSFGRRAVLDRHDLALIPQKENILSILPHKPPLSSGEGRERNDRNPIVVASL
jgi:hypothetical protein